MKKKSRKKIKSKTKKSPRKKLTRKKKRYDTTVTFPHEVAQFGKTIKPLTDFALGFTDSFKPVSDLVINVNKLNDTADLLKQQIEPLNILNIQVADKIKPLVDLTKNLEIITGTTDLIKQQIEPLNILNTQVADQIKSLTDIHLELPSITPLGLYPGESITKISTNLDEVTNEINKTLLANSINYYNPDELEVVEKPIKKSKKKKIKQLIEKLKNCEDGAEDWAEYQDVCEEILSYCFGTDLMEPMVQSATTGRHNIRDIIYQIPHDCDEFWKYIMFQFGMGVIVECKNYASPIKQNDVVITSKYFAEKKLTTFGIIFSRKPVGNSGKKGQEDAWVHNNKMIICLSDDDLIKMLELKEKGEKPWKVIDNAMREFRLSI